MSAPALRVVHLIGTLDRGGAETVALDLCRAVPATQVQQVFLTMGGAEGSLAPQFVMAGAIVQQCPLAPATTFAPRLWWRLRRLRPDVVVSHVSLVSGFTLAVAAAAGVPVRIARMHSEGDGRPDSLGRRLKRALLRAVLRRSATHVVGVTAAALAFARPPAEDGRYAVLPNGVDVERFRLAEPDGSPAGHDPVMVHIGRAAPEKNRPFLAPLHAQAKQLHPRVRLLVVGPGGVSDLAAADPHVGADPSVELLGETDHVEKILAGADVLLLPSIREGLPGVVLEALASGVPVLASDLPGLRDLALDVRGLQLLPLAAGHREWARVALALARTEMPERRRISETVRESPYALQVSARQWTALWSGGG